MELNIDITSIKNRVISNLAKRLMGKFRPSSQNDISDAILLACYFYFTGNAKEAINLLESFLYFSYEEKPEAQRHLWVDNCEGILLLAYIQRCEGIKPVETKLKYIMGNDAQVNPTKFMLDDLRYSIKSNEKYLKQANTETPKYQCQTYVQQVLKFISLTLLWPQFAKKVVFVNFKPVSHSKVNEILQLNINLLKLALDSAANK